MYGKRTVSLQDYYIILQHELKKAFHIEFYVSADWNRLQLYAGQNVERNNLLNFGRKERHNLFIELDKWDAFINITIDHNSRQQR
jgi:hypothetical protein